MLTGLALTALGTVPFAWAGPTTSQRLLAAALFVRGAGLPGVTIAVIAGAFGEVSPPEIPDANSTIRILQQIGGSFGAAVLAVILASELLSHHALTAGSRGLAVDTAFWWAAGLTAVTFLPAPLLPAARRQADEPRPGQAA